MLKYSSFTLITSNIFKTIQGIENPIADVMVSKFASTVVDCGFKPQSGQTKYYKIDICCFFTKNAVLRTMSKDWLTLNQNNVSDWSDMSHRLLFQ
jgi:hypothetical protein